MDTPKRAKRYVKLPGRGQRGVATLTSLWMGEDHLLQVETTRFSEDYRRFYFKDIKAISVRRTTKWETINLIAGCLFFFPGLFAFLAGNIRPGGGKGLMVFFGIVSGISLVVLLLNLLFGPTCVCSLKTSVQYEVIPSLKRLRTTWKVIRRIRPLVEAAQGVLPPEALQVVARMLAVSPDSNAASKMADWSSPGTATVQPGQLPPPLPVVSVARHLKWRFSLIGALAMNVAACGYLSASHGEAGMVFLWTALLATGGIVLTWMGRGGVARSVAITRVALWVGWIALIGGYWYVAGMKYALKHPGVLNSTAMAFTSLDGSFFSMLYWAMFPFSAWAIAELAGLAFAFAKGPGTMVAPSISRDVRPEQKLSPR